MMRFTPTRLRSGYVAFLRETAGRPEFQGLSIAQRGKAVGKAYNALSAARKKELADVGRRMKFPKRIHGHSGFQFYMKTHGGIIDEQAAKWRGIDVVDKKGYRNRGRLVPLIKRAASKPEHLRRALSPWALFLKKNKREFAGCTGRQALTITRKLAKEFKAQFYKQ